MHSAMVLLVAYAVGSLLLVPLVVGAGWVASWIVRRLRVEIAHRIWVAALLLAVVVPGLPALHDELGRAFRRAGTGGAPTASVRAAQGVGGWSLVRPLSLSPGASWVVCVLYGGSVLWAMARLVRSVCSTARLMARASPCVLEPEVAKTWEDAQGALGVGSRLLLSPDVSGPVTVGFRRPSVFLPACVVEMAEKQDLRAAMVHELAHIRRRDFAKNLWYEVLSLPIAFHPAAWLLKARVAETREMVCDALAVELTMDRKEYGRALLRLAMTVGSSRQAVFSNAIGVFDANVLEKRVMEMRVKKQPTARVWRYGLVLAGAVCLSLTIAAGASAPVVIAGGGMQQAGSAEVYQVGKDVTAPVLKSEAQPEFPEAVRKGKGSFSGSCEVALVVDRTGVPRDVHVVRSLGNGFDESAVKAVEQYRFSPGMRLGKAVPVALFIDVNFQKF